MVLCHTPSSSYAARVLLPLSKFNFAEKAKGFWVQRGVVCCTSNGYLWSISPTTTTTTIASSTGVMGGMHEITGHQSSMNRECGDK